MSEPIPISLFDRDGTSQARRREPALEPESVLVDERTWQDWLAFTEAFSRELKFFDLNNHEAGDFGAFLNPNLLDADQPLARWREIEAFLASPKMFEDARYDIHRRPHFTLFLAFLHLLKLTQGRINSLTRRHLDFYFQEVLRLKNQPGLADRVHIIVKPSPYAERAHLPKGTLLDAGIDSLGNAVAYRTEREIIANHIQVESRRSVFVNNKTTGLKDAREQLKDTQDKAVIEMLKLALGNPDPGDALPKYAQREVNYSFLKELKRLVEFSQHHLYLAIWELRNLLKPKNRRMDDDKGWSEINGILEKIGKNRTGDAGYKLNPRDPRDFDDNLNKALGGALPDFSDFSDINDIYELYVQRQRTDDVQPFILNQLYLDLASFGRLMQLKNGIDKDWRDVNILLEKAGVLKSPGFSLNLTNPASPNFAANLKTALGDLVFPVIAGIPDITDLDSYATAIQGLENYFFMQAEDFAFMMDTAEHVTSMWMEINDILEKAGKNRTGDAGFKLNPSDPRDFDANLKTALGGALPNFSAIFSDIIDIYQLYDQRQRTDDVQPFILSQLHLDLDAFAKMMQLKIGIDKGDPLTKEWESVYETLTEAHKKKVYASRRQDLKNLRNTSANAEEQKAEVLAMLSVALADPAAVSADIDGRLPALLLERKNLSLIKKAADGDQGLSDEDWDAVYELLELAWRNRVGTEPVAQKVEWLYLSANEDATKVLAASGDGSTARWRTFGQGQSMPDKDHPPTAMLGWAVSSPLLSLSQGLRTITLTLGFQAAQFNQDKIKAVLEKDSGPFLIQFSTGKGWMERKITARTDNWDYPILPLSAAPESESLKAIQWVMTFDETIPPITNLPAEADSINASWPLIRLLLLPVWETDAEGKNGRYLTPYPLFQSLVLERVSLKVEVSGLKDFKAQNDDTTLNPGKPFEPFGSRPSAGSKLYLGHSELSVKRLDTLDLELQWMGVPADLSDYYKNYTYPVVTTDAQGNTTVNQNPFGGNAVFKATLQLVDKNMEILLSDAGGAALFDTGEASEAPTIKIGDVPAQIDENGKAGYAYKRDLEASTGDELKSWRRYFSLELQSPDFQHSAYPAFAMAKSVELAAAIANKIPNIDANLFKVNPPYTPKLKSLSLGYSSSEEIVLADYQTGTGAERVYHQMPFGYAEFQSGGKMAAYGFLPPCDWEGELYLGLSGVEAPQNLAMLMQMAEGSANPDLEPGTVEWSYLSGNQWLSLNDELILADTTLGLLESGIIEFQLPAAQPNTLLPSSLYWLRAAMAKDCASVCDTVAILTQAVAASFEDQSNAADHLAQPLKVNTIAKPVEPIANILALHQPYTSFDGRQREQTVEFRVRVSERLRHKQRALTPWDYERLILERFPQIYKAKCLSQAQPVHPDDLGRVEVIVIPDIRNRFPFNPFEPKAPAGLIKEIAAFLEKQMPPFASVRVRNARFVQVKARLAVRFNPGVDLGYYKLKLNEDINQFLSPWAYDASKDIVIGGNIYANAIINYIERLDYVDYLGRFKLFSSTDNGIVFTPASEPKGSVGYRVEAGGPDCVLVAARQHEIDLITEPQFLNQNFTGINYMRIELDFEVA